MTPTYNVQTMYVRIHTSSVGVTGNCTADQMICGSLLRAAGLQHTYLYPLPQNSLASERGAIHMLLFRAAKRLVVVAHCLGLAEEPRPE